MSLSSVPEIRIYTRHSKQCPYKDKGEYYRNCECFKYLRWSHAKRQLRVATKSRTWEGAMAKKDEIEKRYYAEPPIEWYDEIRGKLDRLTAMVESLSKRTRA